MPNKMISLSEDMFFKLKQEDNASGLIESLLFKHYQAVDISKMKPEEKLKKLKEIELRLEAHERIKKLKSEMKEIEEQTKKKLEGLNDELHRN